MIPWSYKPVTKEPLSKTVHVLQIIYIYIHVCLYMYNLQCTISSTFTIIIIISGMYLWLWQLMINCNGIHDEQVLMQLADSSKYYILYFTGDNVTYVHV